MEKYPYYTIARFDAGILNKLTTKKFSTYDEICKVRDKWLAKNDFSNYWQIIIMEYTLQYKGKILSIITNGKETIVSDPISNI